MADGEIQARPEPQHAHAAQCGCHAAQRLDVLRHRTLVLAESLGGHDMGQRKRHLVLRHECLAARESPTYGGHLTHEHTARRLVLQCVGEFEEQLSRNLVHAPHVALYIGRWRNATTHRLHIFGFEPRHHRRHAGNLHHEVVAAPVRQFLHRAHDALEHAIHDAHLVALGEAQLLGLEILKSHLGHCREPHEVRHVGIGHHNGCPSLLMAYASEKNIGIEARRMLVIQKFLFGGTHEDQFVNGGSQQSLPGALHLEEHVFHGHVCLKSLCQQLVPDGDFLFVIGREHIPPLLGAVPLLVLFHPILVLVIVQIGHTKIVIIIVRSKFTAIKSPHGSASRHVRDDCRPVCATCPRPPSRRGSRSLPSGAMPSVGLRWPAGSVPARPQSADARPRELRRDIPPSRRSCALSP